MRPEHYYRVLSEKPVQADHEGVIWTKKEASWDGVPNVSIYVRRQDVVKTRVDPKTNLITELIEEGSDPMIYGLQLEEDRPDLTQLLYPGEKPYPETKATFSHFGTVSDQVRRGFSSILSLGDVLHEIFTQSPECIVFHSMCTATGFKNQKAPSYEGVNEKSEHVFTGTYPAYEKQNNCKIRLTLPFKKRDSSLEETQFTLPTIEFIEGDRAKYEQFLVLFRKELLRTY